jgi:hypothetical protein
MTDCGFRWPSGKALLKAPTWVRAWVLLVAVVVSPAEVVEGLAPESEVV